MKSRRTFLKRLGIWVAASTGLAHRGIAQSAQGIVKSVRDLGFQFRDNEIGVTGKDGATSMRLPDGRSLWTFGDTMEFPFESIRDQELTNVTSSTGCIVPPQDASRGIREFEDLKSADGKRPRPLLHFAGDEDRSEQRLWPMDGVCVGEYLYLFYHRITILPGTSVFVTFDLNGMGIAKARIGEFKFERLKAPDGTFEFWKGDVPTYGVCVQQLDDGYVYLWGSLMTGMYLARTRPETIEQPEHYEYLAAVPTIKNPTTKVEWSRAFNPQAALFDSVPNEMSASFNPHLKKYVAVHTLNTENQLVLRTAPSIVGPWSAPEVFHRPKKTDSTMSFYAAKEHPELAREGGRIIYVTFVDSVAYMPRLVEVTLH